MTEAESQRAEASGAVTGRDRVLLLELAAVAAMLLGIHMGYPAGTELTVNSLTLIWGPQGTGSTSIHGFNIYFQSPEAFAAAWDAVLSLLGDGEVKPVIDRTYPLEEAAQATRHLIEDRPFGKVVLTV